MNLYIKKSSRVDMGNQNMNNRSEMLSQDKTTYYVLAYQN